jgi:FMN reductase
MSMKPLIVGLGGTTRDASTSERALTLALQHCERLGARTLAFTGLTLNLPPYDPANAGQVPQAQPLIDALRQADGVIVATPSYHGSISGMVKNALDYTEDMRTDARPYFDGRAVGCIVVAEGAQAMGSTLIALRSIVHALRGWPTPYAATLDAKARPFASDDGPPDGVNDALATVAQQVVAFAQMAQMARSARTAA